MGFFSNVIRDGRPRKPTTRAISPLAPSAVEPAAETKASVPPKASSDLRKRASMGEPSESEPFSKQEPSLAIPDKTSLKKSTHPSRLESKNERNDEKSEEIIQGNTSSQSPGQELTRVTISESKPGKSENAADDQNSADSSSGINLDIKDLSKEFEKSPALPKEPMQSNDQVGDRNHDAPARPYSRETRQPDSQKLRDRQEYSERHVSGFNSSLLGSIKTGDLQTSKESKSLNGGGERENHEGKPEINPSFSKPGNSDSVAPKASEEHRSQVPMVEGFINKTQEEVLDAWKNQVNPHLDHLSKPSSRRKSPDEIRQVHIGQIDIVVESAQKPTASKTFESAADLASQLYLRRI